MKKSLILSKFFFVMFVFVLFNIMCEDVATGEIFALDYTTGGWVLFISYWLLSISVSVYSSTEKW